MERVASIISVSYDLAIREGKIRELIGREELAARGLPGEEERIASLLGVENSR